MGMLDLLWRVFFWSFFAQTLLFSQNIRIQELKEEIQKGVEKNNFTLVLLATEELVSLSKATGSLSKEFFPLLLEGTTHFAPRLKVRELNQWFQLLTTLYPEEGVLEYMWVTSLCGLQDYDEAEKHYKQGADKPTQVSEEVLKVQKSLALTSLALYNFSQQEEAFAKKRLELALQLYPANSHARSLLVQLESSLQDLPFLEILKQLESALDQKLAGAFYLSFEALQGREFQKEERIHLFQYVVQSLELFGAFLTPQERVQWFELFHTLYPDEAFLEYLWANLYVLQGDSSQAFLHFQAGEKKASLFEEALLQEAKSLTLTLLAQEEMKQERWKSAQEYLQEALLLNAKNSQARLLRTQVESRFAPLESFETLLKNLKFALNDPKEFQTLLNAIRGFSVKPLSVSEKEALFPYIIRATEQFTPLFEAQDLEVWFQLLRQIFPQEVLIDYLYVNILSSLQEYEKAEALYSQAQEKTSFFPERIKAYKSTALTSLAVYNVEQGQVALGQKRLFLALEIDSLNARALMLLGKLAASPPYYQWKASIYYFEQALERDPRVFYGIHYLIFARSLFHEKDFKRAQEVIQEGLRRFPLFLDLYMMQADLYLSQNQPILAYLNHQLAYLLSPAHSKILEDRMNRVIRRGEQAQSEPSRPENQFILAFESAVSHLLKDPQYALERIRFCENLLSAQHPVLQFVLGIALEKSQKTVEALACYEKLVEDAPYFIPAYVRLFKFYAKQEKGERMVFWLNQALSLDKNNAWIVQVYYVTLLENPYSILFYKQEEATRFREEKRQVFYFNGEELLSLCSSLDMLVCEKALKSFQKWFKKDFGFTAQSSLEERNQAIQTFKEWFPQVKDYLIYSAEQGGFIVDEEARQLKVPLYFWHQVSEEKKKTWPNASPEQKAFWLKDMKNFLEQSKPYPPGSLLPVYLIPHLD
jgi:tetratricopeptide (TPR) repeat protein